MKNKSSNDQLIVIQIFHYDSLIKLWPNDFNKALIFWSDTYHKNLINNMIRQISAYFNISFEDLENNITNQFMIEYNNNHYSLNMSNLTMIFNRLIKAITNKRIFTVNIQEVTTEYIQKYKLLAYTTDLL